MYVRYQKPRMQPIEDSILRSSAQPKAHIVAKSFVRRWSLCRNALSVSAAFVKRTPHNSGMRRFRMASFTSYGGRALLCAAVEFLHSFLQSMLTTGFQHDTSAPRPPLRAYIVFFGERSLRRSCVLRYLLALALGHLSLVFWCHTDTLYTSDPSTGAKSLALFLCGYICLWLLIGKTRFYCRYSTCHAYPSHAASSLVLCCYKPMPRFPVLKGEFVSLLFLLLPQALVAEQVICTRSYHQSGVSPPVIHARTFVSPLVASRPSCSAILGAGDCISKFHNERSHTLSERFRSPSKVVANRYFGRMNTLILRESAEASRKPCTLLSFRKSETSLAVSSASHYLQKRVPVLETCGQQASCQVLKLQRPLHRSRKCAFFAFPIGHPYPACAMLRTSPSSQCPYVLFACQTSRIVARRLGSAIPVPTTKHSYVLSRASENTASGRRPYTWLLSCGAGTHDGGIAPTAFRTPRASFLACLATARSRAQELVEEIKKLTIIEVAELVSLVEQSFGIQGARAAAADLAERSRLQGSETEKPEGAEQAKPVEKKTAFSVEIKAVPLEKRIGVIKTLRTVRPDLGLKDAKGLIDTLPSTILNNISKEKAEEAQKILADAGAQVEVK